MMNRLAHRLAKSIGLMRLSLEWFFVNRIVSGLPFRTIRAVLLSLSGVHFQGNRVSMFGGFEIRNPRGLRFLGECSLGPRVRLDARRGIDVGCNVTIAAEVMIWTLQHDKDDPDFRTTGGKVELGDYTWIGARAMILPGVKVCHHAVVAAGAVVTHDVPPFSVVAGVPAREIGKRSKTDYRYSPYYPLFFV